MSLVGAFVALRSGAAALAGASVRGPAVRRFAGAAAGGWRQGYPGAAPEGQVGREALAAPAAPAAPAAEGGTNQGNAVRAPLLAPSRVRSRGGALSDLPSGSVREVHTSTSKPKDFNVDELFINNKAWRDRVVAKDADFFARQASGQSPRYLWIGCSDSRVPAETICGMEPGTLFVMRNIANSVNNLDMSAMSVLQFAVTVLKVQHIVICGHYNCGGVAASMKNQDHQSPLENWLRNIRDVYRLHRKELDAIEDLDLRARRLVEINVIEQAINLYKVQVVQKRRVETYQQLGEFGFVQPKIHPCVYEPGTGILTRLDVQMQDYIKDLYSIYNLYSVDESKDVKWEGMGPSTVLP